MSGLDARILAILHASQVHLFATDLAGQLGAPLANIEARLTELRNAGFEIEERPGLGFRLLRSPDRLIADDLHARLGPCALAREIVVFAETASTNDSATQRGRQGSAGGLVIFAERQTAGRGRFGRAWASAPYRGLWFSLLLRPEFPTNAWPRLTTWAAVSLAATIESSLGLAVSIKWPNDIFLSGKKIAGILAESGTDVNGQPFAVVGIGVNVNHAPGDFPAELAGKAASLNMVTGRTIDRPTLAANLLRDLDARLPQIASAFPDMIAEAARRSLLLGRWVQVQSGHTIMEGRAEELDADGHLVLRGSNGSLNRLSAGEVTVIAN
ncbi:MAG: biotin--[acetyl-CoA-carboxylase] ligase [Chthoniobacter sp.]|uniref:biotin--[acetyl-CoA-carboxylase] ligase n=1 Tax=Chthoniobacter sp. TaxID=2510640 RepID=UPI0032A739F1